MDKLLIFSDDSVFRCGHCDKLKLPGTGRGWVPSSISPSDSVSAVAAAVREKDHIGGESCLWCDKCINKIGRTSAAIRVAYAALLIAAVGFMWWCG